MKYCHLTKQCLLRECAHNRDMEGVNERNGIEMEWDSITGMKRKKKKTIQIE